MKNNNVSFESFVYYLYIISYLLDPTGLFINIKIPALALLLFWNIYSRKKINILSFVLIVFVYFVISYSATNMLLSEYYYDNLELITSFITYLNLIPIIFITERTDVVVSAFLLSCNFLVFLTLSVTVIVLFFPMIAFIFEFEPLNTIFIMQKRPILGKDFYMIYHLSSSVVVLGLGVYLSNWLLGKRNLLLLIFYLFAIFFTGARANMLSGALIVIGCFIYYQYKYKKKLFLCIFIFIVTSFAAVIMIFLLLFDPKSGSNDIKYNHLLSYLKLFENNMNILLLGNGLGSWFFTTGFNSYTQLTELSYLDIIRVFGVFGGSIVFLLYILPLIKILNWNNLLKFSMFLSYSAYLFIAGTNPLLVVPQGFVVLFVMYSIAFQKNRNY